jgi:hypothetical protein
MPFHNTPRIGALACLEVKMIGKPYAGELHVRFDEGEQDFVSRRFLNGHEAGNGGYSQGPTYQAMSLFSTLPQGPRRNFQSVSERQSQAPADVISAKGFINSARPVHLSHQNPRLIRLSCQTSLPIRLKSPKLFHLAR